jgi:hypothetical protein
VLRRSEALVDTAIWNQKEKSPSSEYLRAGCRFHFVYLKPVSWGASE